jgi:hypothetical protein
VLLTAAGDAGSQRVSPCLAKANPSVAVIGIDIMSGLSFNSVPISRIAERSPPTAIAMSLLGISLSACEIVACSGKLHSESIGERLLLWSPSGFPDRTWRVSTRSNRDYDPASPRGWVWLTAGCNYPNS